MSAQSPHVDVPNPPSHYVERADAGDETWLEDAIAEYLGIHVTEPQRRICRALVNHQYTVVVTGNGLGKSYILAAIANVWLVCRYPATAFATSGTEKKMRRTLCRSVEKLHDGALDGHGLPGRYKQMPPRIDFPDDPEHFFEASSPSDAGELEGVHSAHSLGIIEEAEKDAVDEDIVDAMRSHISDENDRLIAIANPPEDEANVVADLMESPEWHTVRISTFDSHNVAVDRGELDGPYIDGIAGLSTLENDWVAYNNEEWPGFEAARAMSNPEHPDFREDLGKRWYKRRAGVIPPAGASEKRPFYLHEVTAAYEPDYDGSLPAPTAFAMDVARAGGDRNAIAAARGDAITIEDVWMGTDHVDNESRAREIFDEAPTAPIIIDAMAEGSGLADRIQMAYPNVHRFGAGHKPADETAYKDCWAEGLAALGDFFDSGGIILDNDLRKEAAVAARTISFEERYLASRGEDGEMVYQANSKDDIKDVLDRSPDLLDAAYMAAWGDSGSLDAMQVEVTRRRGGSKGRRRIQKHHS